MDCGYERALLVSDRHAHSCGRMCHHPAEAMVRGIRLDALIAACKPVRL
jgi:hypothetical protein